MALTTIAGVISGLQPPARHIKSALVGAAAPSGRIASTWTIGGWPAAGGIGSTTPGNSLTAPVTGRIDFTNPVSGETVLARMQMVPQNQSGDFLLVDRLWHMSGISPTVTTAQTVSSSAWPARDINQSSNGAGVYVALEVTTATSTGTPSLSMTYTNSAGTAGQIGAGISPTIASSPVGTTHVMGLAAGDVGVRSVADFTLSATWTSGALSLMAFRPIVLVPGGSATASPVKLRKRIEDVLTMAAPRIWNGSVLELWFLPSSASGPTLTGSISVAQG